jgi:DNA-binding transcriptional MerR regulator
VPTTPDRSQRRPVGRVLAMHIQEVAAAAGISVDTLKRLARRRLIPHTRDARGYRVFDPSVVTLLQWRYGKQPKVSQRTVNKLAVDAAFNAFGDTITKNPMLAAFKRLSPQEQARIAAEIIATMNEPLSDGLVYAPPRQGGRMGRDHR